MHGTRADHVLGNQKRDGEAEQYLCPFSHRHGQRAALVEREQRQKEMRGDRAVEEQRPGRVAPDQQEHRAPLISCFKRDQEQRMVQEMQRHERHQHKAGHQPCVAEPRVRQPSGRWCWDLRLAHFQCFERFADQNTPAIAPSGQDLPAGTISQSSLPPAIPRRGGSSIGQIAWGSWMLLRGLWTKWDKDSVFG